MLVNEKIVMSKEYDGMIKTVLRDGICIYKGKTEEYYIENGYTIVTEKEFEVIQEKHLNDMCNNWKEITEDKFEDALNVLPPMRWENGGFFISERYTSDVTNFYQQIGNRYFTSYQRLSYKRDDILDNLKLFINSK